MAKSKRNKWTFFIIIVIALFIWMLTGMTKDEIIWMLLGWLVVLGAFVYILLEDSNKKT